MEERKVILKKYNIKEIYNIPEIMEVEVPFPYNISVKNNKVELLSPIELRKEEMKDNSIYWVIKTPSITLYDYDVKKVISKWNEYVRNILYKKFAIQSYKTFGLIGAMINFIVFFTLGILNCPFDIILLNLFGLNLLIVQVAKNPTIKYITNKDVKNYINNIISIAKYDYSYYNCRPLFGLADTIHIDTKIKEPEKKSCLQSFIDILNEEIENVKYEKIKSYLNDIKEYNIEIAQYNNNNIIMQNEINNVKNFNNHILDIIQILDGHPDKKMIIDIENILNNYLDIYKYYKESILDSYNTKGKIKLELIKNDIKAQKNYISLKK